MVPNILLVVTLNRLFHLDVEVKGDVGNVLLLITHDLAFRCRSEGVAALRRGLQHVLAVLAGTLHLLVHLGGLAHPVIDGLVQWLDVLLNFHM